MSEEAIYEYFVDCGRMGEVEGLIIAEVEDVEKIIEEAPEIWFGEILGKHSEIVVDTQANQFKELTRDPEEIKVIRKVLKCSNTISGYNPFDYWEEE